MALEGTASDRRGAAAARRTGRRYPSSALALHVLRARAAARAACAPRALQIRQKCRRSQVRSGPVAEKRLNSEGSYR
eukprot:5837646-Pyramimonas_sp.AAC.1